MSRRPRGAGRRPERKTRRGVPSPACWPSTGPPDPPAAALERDADKRAKYIEFIDIYAGLTDNEFQRYQRQYPEESTTMAGVIQRARDEGMQQGMQQGRVEGERVVLERQLRRRFGLLPPEVAERLSEASATDLETWAENVLDAQALDDVFDSGR